MQAMQRRALELMREFESQNIGNTLWAFATLGFNPGTLLSLLVLLVPKLLSLLASLVALGVRDARFQPWCATQFTYFTSTTVPILTPLGLLVSGGRGSSQIQKLGQSKVVRNFKEALFGCPKDSWIQVFLVLSFH